MAIDLRTVNIDPVRQTFDHLVRRFGDRPSSRYQEGSYDLQPVENLHYRPTWDPDQEIYDTAITRIVMQDWHALKDPRQFYYNTYTVTRARQQEAAEVNFGLVESRSLADALDAELRATALKVLVPLRHAAWGANQNNAFISGYGYGAPLTQACMYCAMDHLGIAQYLSRIGLVLGDADALVAAKVAWQEGEEWQPLRRYTEDSMVVRDPFELFVAQNLALDGLLYPLVYQRIVDGQLPARGGAAITVLTQFMTDWFGETRKWVDAVISVAAKESEQNRQILTEWLGSWGKRAAEALTPVAALALADSAGEAVAEQVQALHARVARAGINL